MIADIVVNQPGGDAESRLLFSAMMPVFSYRSALKLLLLVPWFAWRFVKQPLAAWQFSDSRLFPSIVSPRVRWASWGGLVLRLGALALLIIAISGPRWIDERERIPADGISIAMVLDV